MNATGAALERSFLGRYFKFAEHGTTIGRDTLAGATTFIVMSYIIFVNPTILSFVGIEGLQDVGLPFQAVLASTCIVAGGMSILMGLATNKAFAIAPGMGLNAVVAFGLVATAGLSFPEAMGIVVMEGVLVLIFVLTGLREKVMRAIPLELKKAIAIGIGLFIAFIGLFNSGIVQTSPAAGVPVELGDFTSWPVLVTIFGIVFTLALRARGFRGDLLVGIIGTTVFATLVNWATNYEAFDIPGVARWPEQIAATPDLSLLGEFSFGSFATLGIVATLVWVFALFLADFFDTMGTIVGVGKQAGYVKPDGEVPGLRGLLVVDSIGAIAGGAASASSATTYIESGSGVAAGGRTGWASVVTGLLFFPFLFFAPLIGMVPPHATAAALIVVGWLMISTLTEAEEEAEPGVVPVGTTTPEAVAAAGASTGGTVVPRKFAGIDFHDVAIGVAAALTIMVMPFTYSITNGIGFGFIAYTLIRVAQGRARDVHPLMYGATVAFILFFLVPLLQQTFDWI
jgi:adenine/guanine/hypoxanthine permease